MDGWGNARDVDKVWKECLQQRADRVVKKPEGVRGEGHGISGKSTTQSIQPSSRQASHLQGAEKTLQESDVRPAIQKLLAARGPKAAPTVPSFPGDARCEMPSQAQEPLGRPFGGFEKDAETVASLRSPVRLRKPVQSQKQAQREEEAPAEAPGPADVDERDPGVSDEDWQDSADL